ncbi:HD domain-containing protein [Fodinicurvata sediminis]|uniref:HD domain-containing protein n=1 Tax=Fodinicurvata sediminis TaxID=1121832 RepID=UPI0003B40FE3|nr:HD domain-containing protein [Fodinicurvata sediminis]
MDQVSFTRMSDGTRADYHFLDRLEQDHAAGVADRILAALAGLEHSLEGYQVTRLEHSLQTATRAEADGADSEMVVAALVHDLGDDLAPHNHSQFAAAILRPYVRQEVTWVLEMHGLFQMQFYADRLGLPTDRHLAFADHPYFESCQRFCRDWDQESFDPHYPTKPLSHFAPVLREIFARPPFDPAILKEQNS